MKQKLTRKSWIYRNFWYEEIRSKVYQYQWFKFDAKKQEVVFDESVFARFRTLIPALPALLLSGLSLHYFYTKQSLNVFELISVAMLGSVLAGLLQFCLREKEVRKALYNLINELELVDGLMSKFYYFSKKNRFVNHNLAFISVTLLIYNSVGIPSIVLFFTQPSTKAMGVLFMVGVHIWPAAVYSTMARGLIADRLSIFAEVVRSLSKQDVDKLTCKQVSAIFVVFKSLLDTSITTDQLVIWPICIVECIFATGVVLLLLSQLLLLPIEMHPFGIFMCITLCLEHAIVSTFYFVATTAIGSEICNVLSALHKFYYKSDNEDIKNFLICMSHELSNAKYCKFKLADALDVDSSAYLVLVSSITQMGVLLLDFEI